MSRAEKTPKSLLARAEAAFIDGVAKTYEAVGEGVAQAYGAIKIPFTPERNIFVTDAPEPETPTAAGNEIVTNVKNLALLGIEAAGNGLRAFGVVENIGAATVAFCAKKASPPQKSK